MISMSRAFSLTTLWMAGMLIHRLFVLNTLNFFTSMNSSMWSFGTWRGTFWVFWVGGDGAT